MSRFRSSSTPLGILLLARIAIDLDFLSITLYFSTFSTVFDVEIWLMGFVISVYSVCVLFSPVFGSISDQYGRRRFLLLGLVIFSISSGIMVIAQDWVQVLTARAISGIATAIFMPSLLAELADTYSYQKRTRAMGLVRLSWPLTFIVGVPLVGYSIEHLDWRLPFVILTVLALCAGALIALTEPSGNKTHEQRPTARKSLKLVKRVLSDRNAFSGLLLMMFAAGAIQGIFAFFPVWMETDLLIEETSISIILAFMGGGTLIGTLLATGIGDKIGPKKCAIIGLIAAAGCMIFLSNFSFRNPLLIVFWLILLGTSFDFSMTVVPVLLTQIASDAKGTILSLNQSLNAGATALGSAFSGILWINFGYPTIGLFFGGIAFLGALIGFFKIEIEDKEEDFIIDRS